MRTSSRILGVSFLAVLSNCSIGGLPEDQVAGAGGIGGNGAGGAARSVAGGKTGSNSGAGGTSGGNSPSVNTSGGTVTNSKAADAGSGGTDTGNGMGGAADAGSGGMDSGGDAGSPGSGGVSPASGGKSSAGGFSAGRSGAGGSSAGSSSGGAAGTGGAAGGGAAGNGGCIGGATTALSFDGTGNSWVRLGNSNLFNSSVFTVESWVYLRGRCTSGDSCGIIFEKWTNSAEDKWLSAGYWDAGYPDFGFFNGLPAGAVHVESPALAPVGRWFHIAGIHDGSEARLYIDGHLVATSADSGSVQSSNGMAYIGANASRPGYKAINGFIGELRLSSSAKYDTDFVPAAQLPVETDTLGLWRLDEGQVSTAVDESGNGLDGTLSPLATWESVPSRTGCN